MNIDINISENYARDGLAIYNAVESGHLDIVAKLLEHYEQTQADIGTDSCGIDHLLRAAARKGHNPVIRLLLDHGADIDVPDFLQETPLIKACIHGHMDTIVLLLELGANPDAHGIAPRDPEHYISMEGNTVLQHAATGGDNNMVNLLLDHGAGIDFCNEHAGPPLHIAVGNGRMDTVRLLLSRGASVQARDLDGDSVLHVAAYAGELDMLRAFMPQHSDVDILNRRKFTPLHWAAIRGHNAIVTPLLSAGANVNARDKYGQTILHMAALNGRLETVVLLLEQGAKLYAADNKGRNSLHKAASEGYLDVVRLLSDKGVAIDGRTKHGETALHLAASGDHTDVCRYLLDRGADARVTDKKGNTPLHNVFHIRNHHDRDPLFRSATVHLLVEADADVDVLNEAGYSPLHLAVSNLYEEATRDMLQRGADMRSRAKGTDPALHLAIRQGANEMVRILIDHGAELTAANKEGDTPLRLALAADMRLENNNRSERADIVQLLLTMGVRPNETDHHALFAMYVNARRLQSRLTGRRDILDAFLQENLSPQAVCSDTGDTLLHLICRDHYAAIAEIGLPLRRGADVNARNHRGETPLLAYVSRRKPLPTIKGLQMLLEHQADPNLMDDKGNTPLGVCQQHGLEQLAQCLMEYGAVPLVYQDRDAMKNAGIQGTGSLS